MRFRSTTLVLGLAVIGCGDDETTPEDPLVIKAPEGEWTFVEVEGAVCGTGTPTGLGINPTASGKVLVFLEAGGACFSEMMCLGEDPSTSYFTGFGAAEMDGVAAELTGAFNRSDPDNPFRDHSFVYIPYCTGDVHTGGTVNEEGEQPLHFVGHENIAAALPRIVATFPDPEQVVLAGSSAGGFGTMYNFHQVQTAFEGTSVVLIDDSGPFFPLSATPALIVVRDIWHLADTVPPGCPLCLDEGDPDGGLHQLIPLYQESFPGLRASLISSLRDETITERFIIEPSDFEDALNSLADDVIAEAPAFRVYYLEGDHHVWLDGDEDSGLLGAVVSNGVQLSTFLDQQLNGDDAWANVRP